MIIAPRRLLVEEGPQSAQGPTLYELQSSTFTRQRLTAAILQVPLLSVQEGTSEHVQVPSV